MKLNTAALIYLLSLLCKCSGLVQNIKIGAIFHEGDEELERAFDLALSDLADEQSSFFNLKPIKKVRVERESFRAAMAVCELLEEGVAAIFGPGYPATRNVVSSVADRFDIPHLEFSFRQRDEAAELADARSSVNLYPNAREYEQLIAETIRYMNWHSYTYIYQTREALSRTQEALSNKARGNYVITLRELQPLEEIRRLETQRERNNVYESFVKDIVGTSQFSIAMDVEPANFHVLFDVMKQMNLMSDYFMCLMTNLDSASFNVDQFIQKDSVANVTQFKFIKNSDWSWSVEAALLYDAVFAFNEALTNIFKDVSEFDGDVKILPKPLSCNGDAKYDVGLNITAAILKKTKVGRITGLMTFNERAERQFELDLVNTQAGRTVKVGEWRGNRLRIHENEKEINNTLTEAIKSKIFKVTTRVGSPYVRRVEDENAKGRMIGDKKYEGYCIDLVEKIEEFLDIKCEFEIVPDGNYGTLNPVTKQWNGLIKRLLELKADMAICDLTITSERQSAVDFTAPFMNLGISILFSKPEKIEPDLFSFTLPLSPEVWLCMATAYLFVSLMLFIQARIAPGEWFNPHPCNPEPEELENSFNLTNCMWFTMSCLMQQGCDILPRSPSIRVIASMWWFFVLIMVSSYTANLAAFLTAVKMEDSINDVEDLAKQTKVAYGALYGGSTYSFFKNSNTSLYQRIFNTMNDATASVFTNTNDEGVERVIKSKRKYAFFMESTNIEYQIERHCELQQIGTLLDNKGYGIAMPPNSPYRTMISTAILHLSEKGELQQLKQKWWKQMGGGLCDESNEPENSNELGMSNVGGVFLILLIGCFISTLISIGEFLWNIRTVAIEEKITPWEALVAELKFVLALNTKTKPVRIVKSSSKSTSYQGNDQSDSVHNSTVSSLHRMNSKDSTNIISLNDNL